MSLNNTKSKVKSATKNEKNSKKESFDTFYIPAPNYTQMPNIFVDEIMAKLTGAETKIVLFIIRETFGWQRNWKDLTLDQIEKATGLSRRQTIYSVDSLLKNGLIDKKQKGPKNHLESYYRLVVGGNKYLSKNVSECKNVTPQGCKNVTPAQRALKKEERNVLRNNTKKKTPPTSAIIPLFCYEWKNPRTGVFEKIENGVTQEEFERLKILIGEVAIRETCNKMKKWADDSNGKVLFKNNNLYKKILEWSEKSSLASKEKSQKKKEIALREGSKPVEQVRDRVEQYKIHDAGIVKRFIEKNQDLQNDIRLSDHKVELRNSKNKRIFEEIRFPEPFLLEKLEAWSNQFRQSHI